MSEPLGNTPTPLEVDTRAEDVALKSIALFEFFKGIAVLLAGFGCLALLGRDPEALGEHLLAFLHVGTENYYSAFFLKSLADLNNSKLVLMSVGAAAYATLKAIEGYGLWYAKVWAEWLAIFTGGIYLPFEFYEIYKEVTWVRVLVTLFNVGLVLYLLWLRQKKVARRLKMIGSEIR